MKTPTLFLWPLAAVGCLATVEEYGPAYDYVAPVDSAPAVSQTHSSSEPVLQELHGILDMPDSPNKNREALNWLRRGLDQADARLRSLGIDPREHAYENAYRQARDSGASPADARWEAERDMRNMEIFRAGGIPPNF